MLTLEAAQDNLIRTINDGPAVLDPQLFHGPLDRVLLGLKAHANTISHARLVALEESFPLTRQHLGEELFNQLCRSFAETEAAQASDANAIGKFFPDFLRSQSYPHLVIPAKAGIHNLNSRFKQASPRKTEAQAMDSRLRGNDEVGFADRRDSDPLPTVEQSAIELAQIEWAWLQSYHAADADALALSVIAGLEETALLSLSVRWHPATQLLPITAPLSSQLPDLAGADAVLIIRPDVDVRLLTLDATTAQVTLAAKKSTTIGNLLTLAAEQVGIADPSGPVLTLIGAGALIASGVNDSASANQAI
jgi:hypothetical protein